MPRLAELLAAATPDLPALAAHLDGLSPAERVAAVRTFTRAHQARLFEAMRGFRPVTLDDLVPPGVPPLTGVAHEGRNSLPAFSRFAKVFYRPDDEAAAARERWGYNRTSALVSTTVGPGYYVAYEVGGGEVLVDYTRLPTRAPAGWPPIVSNASRLSRFVYHGTQDALRGLSAHVTIGRASRAGKPMDNWFVLCRVDA